MILVQQATDNKSHITDHLQRNDMKHEGLVKEKRLFSV